MHLKKNHKLQGVARASASCSTTTPVRWWSVCQSAVTVCWSWSAPTVARSAANGETATEDGIDDIEENVATNSADKINIAQPEELMRNIFMLTKDQMLEAHLDQEKFMVIGF
jgi:hypothetical protein